MVLTPGVRSVDIVGVSGGSSGSWIESDAGDVEVWHDFENDVLVAVAESRTERVRRVRRRRPGSEIKNLGHEVE